MFDDEEFDRLAKAGLLPQIPQQSQAGRSSAAKVEFSSGQSSQSNKESDSETDQSITVLRSIAETLDKISTDLQSIDTLLSRVMEE